MSSPNNIVPEKITHPFQLMAAWFVMIIIISSILLTAAAKISSPSWAAGFLVISAVIFIFLVILCVFLMLTKFRPHLQAGSEYATWLRDERRYSTRADASYKIAFQSDPSPSVPVLKRKFRRLSTNQQSVEKVISRTADVEVQVSALDGAEDLVDALEDLGFRASVYGKLNDGEGLSPENHQAIWIGYLIPADIVLEAVKVALKQWPFLRYMHLSKDSAGPDFIHTQIFFGGSTGTAVGRYELRPWSVDEINAIPEGISLGKFHQMVRTKYTKDTRAS